MYGENHLSASPIPPAALTPGSIGGVSQLGEISRMLDGLTPTVSPVTNPMVDDGNININENVTVKLGNANWGSRTLDSQVSRALHELSDIKSPEMKSPSPPPIQN